MSDGANIISGSAPAGAPAEVAAPPAGGMEMPAGAGPSPLAPAPLPPGYEADWADAAEAAAFSVLADPALHFALYGRRQGRHYLGRLARGVEQVVMVIPSYFKQCGIGEYGRYLAGEFRSLGCEVTVVRTSAAARELGPEELAGALVIVNHGPGLFDGLNARLSQGESTAALVQNLDWMAREAGAVPVVIHHSLLPPEHHLLYSRQSLLLEAPIAEVSFIRSGARHFFMATTELGISPVQTEQTIPPGDRSERQETIGFFGFFQYGGKDFDALIHLARELRAKLVGSVATINPAESQKFAEILDEGGVAHDFTSGWIDDTELLARLAAADYFYLPQKDYDHWNNSASARFVANLDRPLFLPPHHPFLDMADGAIFATQHDLPRIVAAVREPAVYAAAVRRVRAFRDRAAMRNTALALRDGLPEALARIGRSLLLGPSETSQERLMELSPEARARAEAAAEGRPRSLARVPQPIQFWRKHYELGDLVEGTLLDSLQAVARAIHKRDPVFAELEAAAAAVEEGRTAAEVLSAAIREAVETRGSTFAEPEIVLLREGRLTDWKAEIAPDRILRHARDRQERRRLLQRQLHAAPAERPAIVNLSELLLLPPEEIRLRRGPAGLPAIDFDFVQAPRRLIDRLNRLIAEASRAGLALDRMMVFDRLLPGEIDPVVRQYVIEDFWFFEGDEFLLQLFRCVAKRDPSPLEMQTLGALLQSHGKRTVIEHVLARADGMVVIAGLGRTPAAVLTEDFALFIAHARDPMFGLFDLRNAYEVLRRNNERWWLGYKEKVDVLHRESGADLSRLIGFHARLDRPLDPAARPAPCAIAGMVGRSGHFVNPRWLAEGALEVPPGAVVHLAEVPPRRLASALRGFHEPETIGVWTNGRSAQMTLRAVLPAGAAAGRPGMVHLGLAFIAAGRLGPRSVAVTVRSAAPGGEWQTTSREAVVAADGPMTLGIPCPEVTDGCLIVLDLHVSVSTSPAAVAISSDARDLGMLVQWVMVELSPADAGEGDQPPSAGRTDAERERMKAAS